MPEFAGFAYSDSGAAVVGATVNLYDRNTTAPVRTTTTTDANGYYAISYATEGRFDVELVNAASKRRVKYDDSRQYEELDVSTFKIRNPANTFTYNIVPAAITAARNLNLPLITGTDTLASLGLAQTFTAAKTFTNGTLLLNNAANTFAYRILGEAITANRDLVVPLITGSDTLVVLGLAQSFTAAKTFDDSTLLIRNPANTFSYTIVPAAITADRNLTLPLITGTDTLATLGLAQTFTAATVFTGGTIFTATNTFLSSGLTIRNPADTFSYTIVSAAITAARNLNLPLITGTDTLVVLALAQTLTNKTLTSPVINTPTGIVKGDVGLGNVDNTSDATKNAASVTLTNKTLTSPVINTPTGIVKGDVGLGNVDNTSDATKNAASVTLTNKTLTSPVVNTQLTGTAVGTGASQVAAGDHSHTADAPTDANYLVGTANAGLSAEIVVGTTPGGELGGTWASPTVDATHSGSAHSSFATLATEQTFTGEKTFTNGTLLLNNATNTFSYQILGAAITANRVLVLPLISGTDTLATVGINNNFVVTQYIGDSANASMTLGLTINQGAADNEILALKSSDVAHGLTDYLETDTFFDIVKAHATAGGVFMRGAGSGATSGFIIDGIQGTANTAKTTSAIGAVTLSGLLKSGAGTAVLGADGNIVVITNAGTVRFIFDAEGSGHADVEWVAFDQHDDLALVADLEKELVPQRFGQAMTYNRDALERTGIIGAGSWHEENGKQHAMVNFTRMVMLHHGTLIQMGQRIMDLEQKLMLKGE